MPDSIQANVKNFIDAKVAEAAVRNNVPVDQIEHCITGEPDSYDNCAFASVIVTTWVKDNRDVTQYIDSERFIAGGDATTPTL